MTLPKVIQTHQITYLWYLTASLSHLERLKEKLPQLSSDTLGVRLLL